MRVVAISYFAAIVNFLSLPMQNIYLSNYDYIIAGAGCAGLSLAYHLQQYADLQNSSILIVDREPKQKNDRTWSFWAKTPTLFDDIIYQSWNQLAFRSPTFTDLLDLGEWRYNTIRGIDFYQKTTKALQKNPRIHWLYGEIEAITSTKSKASIQVKGKTYQANWLFNSCFDAKKIQSNLTKYHYLKQHFKGWVIETPTVKFATSFATLFDFCTPQEEAVRFFYVLPFSNKKALIEYTVFSEKVLTHQAYEEKLKGYIHDFLGIKDYTITEEEVGVIPMTNFPFERKNGERIMNIGTLGGQCKASSGYTFFRIQQDSQRIATSLLKTKQPFHGIQSPKRYSLYDTMLLNIMKNKGGKIAAIFADMFKNNPTARIFKFLNEETTLVEDVKVMASVPSKPFLKAGYNLLRRK